MTSKTDNKVEAAVERLREFAGRCDTALGIPDVGDAITALLSSKEAADQRCERLEAEVERLKAESLHNYNDATQLCARLEAAEAKLSALVEKAEPLVNFSWTAVTADCDESRDYLNGLVASLRTALASLDRTAPESAEPAQEVAGLVEKVARIIDPLAYADFPAGGVEPDHDWWDRQRAIDKAEAILAALASSPSQGGETVDMRKVVEALGFEPDNHHNAVNCPYCNPKGLTFADPLPDVSGLVDRSGVAAADNNHKALVEALERIERWEMPETGRFWPDDYGKPDPKRPMSYASCFGSRGEQSVVRAIARQALAAFQSRKEESR